MVAKTKLTASQAACLKEWASDLLLSLTLVPAPPGQEDTGPAVQALIASLEEAEKTSAVS